MILKPCPRCGSAKIKTYYGNKARVWCGDCGLSSPKFPSDNAQFAEHIDLEAAMEWWNKQKSEADLRAEVTRLEAENERMRGALTEIQQETFDWPLSQRKEEPFIQLIGRLNHIAKDALSPSTDENEEADD